jgi:adenosylcobyric acid synthase
VIKERNGEAVNQLDGVFREDELIIGVTLHDSLGDPAFREFVLNIARENAGLPKRRSSLSSIDLLLSQVDKLVSVIKDSLDVDFMLSSS